MTAAIAGPRTEEQWDSYVRALDYSFTREDEAFVDRLVVEGHASTHGFNDPSHPVEGRVPRTGGIDAAAKVAARTSPTLLKAG